MKRKKNRRDTTGTKSGTQTLRLLMAFCLIWIIGTGNFGMMAQEPQPTLKTITGKVMSAEDNQPIPGANIIIKGTQKGTVTDIDGSFSIEVADADVLQISFIGYLTEEITVGTSTHIDLSLVLDIARLDEVVVIGYGVQQKKLVTGATSQVKGDELEKRNATNALQALQGQAPGINITSKSGQPGEDLRVTIRGLGTIGDASPLYIVDGVQTDDIKYLNNTDIESIDVLKDAASAAIYGSRAANGVVLITTKQGQAGKTEVTFDAYYGLQNRPKKIDLLDAREYAMIMNEQYLNSGGTTAGLEFDLNNLYSYRTDGEGNYLPNANTNWLDEMFVKNAVKQNYSLGVTGGNDQGIYSFSLSYAGHEGIVGGRSLSNYERYNGRFNSEKNLFNSHVKVGQHLVYSHIKKNGVKVGNQYDNTLRETFNTSPLKPVYDDRGDFFNSMDILNVDQNGDGYWYTGEGHPYGTMVYDNQNLTLTHKLVGDVYVEIELINNLNFRTSLGIDYKGEEYRSYTPVYELSEFAFTAYNSARQKMSKDFTINTDNILTYDYYNGPHTLNAMIGMSARSYTGVWLQADGADLAFDDLEHAYMNNATAREYPKMENQGRPEDVDKLLSYFGRIQYNYKETYLLNATFRADGSSKFARGNRWGYFPSVSAGWVLTNEPFMQSTTSYLNFLKLRASWGQNGNQNIDAFQYLAPIKFTQATYAFGNVEGTSIPGAYPERLSYEKLKWETSEQLDIGFDARLFKSRFGVAFDFYRKVTKDWLIKAPVFATAGADPPFINGGNVINTGVELGVDYYKTIGEFTFNVVANGAYNRNKVEEIPTEDGIIHGATNMLFNNSNEFYRAESGHPIGFFWGYEMDGLFQTSGDVTNHTNTEGIVIQPDAKPGDVRFVDQDDDGNIDDDDKIEIGYPNPDLIFGFNFRGSYKGFDVSILTNGVAGNQIVQSYRSQTEKYANYTTTILDRWKGANTSNEIPRVTNGNINYKELSALFIRNGSYLRISDITVGYDVIEAIKIPDISQFRVFVSLQNAYTFTRYDGMDPEVGYGFDNGVDDKFSSGIDLGYYPRPRTILFGVNVKF
ncbi:MAG: TonB-dependent receptor [Bacteroidales bacterium]|nr:TonB-dependent receptor [Bacteroidales bacterium]